MAAVATSWKGMAMAAPRARRVLRRRVGRRRDFMVLERFDFFLVFWWCWGLERWIRAGVEEVLGWILVCWMLVVRMMDGFGMGKGRVFIYVDEVLWYCIVRRLPGQETDSTERNMV
jgi:hypothetical protein